MHAFVFWGFLAFGLITIEHFAKGFGFTLLSYDVHRIYSYIVIPFSLLVIIGIVHLAYRRFVIKPKALGKLSPTSGLVAIFIILLMVTYLLGETQLPILLWKANWWLHSLLILAFLILVPRSKHLHLVLGPFNIFFKPFNQPDHAPVNIDMEASEEELDTMLTNLAKMSKNQALDIFSCVECGRCMDVCPAHRGGGTLNPKDHFILDLRNPLIENQDVDVLASINVEAGW